MVEFLNCFSVIIVLILAVLKGCLAAVLASAYDFDDNDEEFASDATSSKGSFAYLDYADDGDDAENDDDADRSFTYSRASLSGSSFEDSFDADNEGALARRKRSIRSRSSSAGTFRPQNWSWKAKEKEEKAKQRNRRRRYDICCELLMSSSELLLLKNSVARGFLPMLSRILVPRCRSKQNDKSKGRNGLPPRSQRRAKSQSAPNSTVDTTHAPLQMSSSFTMEEYNTVELKVEGDPTDIKEKEKDYETEELDKDDVLQPFLESMTPGSGFRCLSLLLLQHLLTSKVGYDARIRHALKKLGVLVLVHDMGDDPVEQELLHGGEDGNSRSYKELVTHATRKFEALEASVARRIIRLSKTSSPDKKLKDDNGILGKGKANDVGITRDKFFRGVKIGSAGIVAGTLFALTGGLAAPGKSQFAAWRVLQTLTDFN